MKIARDCLTGMLVFGLLSAGCALRSPLHPEAVRLNRLGASSLAAGRLEKARVALELSLEYNPCHAEALHNLATVAYLRGELDQAEAMERRSLGCGELVQAVNGLGAVAARRGRDAEALSHFARAVQLDPGYLDARRNLIATAIRERDWDLAREQLQRLLLLAPGDPAAARLSAALPPEGRP
ncbi:MAG: tetratricopeptide repeat protein [Deltaproteobacteria bacterium]|nr:tetratricopeptide repeat protein [Deltaproteobacteria bacterium]